MVNSLLRFAWYVGTAFAVLLVVGCSALTEPGSLLGEHYTVYGPGVLGPAAAQV